jgi:uncharacterized protein (DUF924 family)
MAQTPEEKKAARRASNRKWYLANAEVRREVQRRYRETHPDANRNWRETHPNATVNSDRKRRFGMTPDEYAQRLAAQNGVCAVCEGNRSTKALGVDHDHKTGLARGLLCSNCNSALGLMDDNATLIRKLAEYRETYP